MTETRRVLLAGVAAFGVSVAVLVTLDVPLSGAIILLGVMAFLVIVSVRRTRRSQRSPSRGRRQPPR